MFSTKFFSFLISFYLLFVNTLSLTHHHSDGQHHPDCQVCVLQLNQQSDDPNELVSVFLIEKTISEYTETLQSTIIPKEISHNILPRSPPVLG